LGKNTSVGEDLFSELNKIYVASMDMCRLMADAAFAGCPLSILSTVPDP